MKLTLINPSRKKYNINVFWDFKFLTKLSGGKAFTPISLALPTLAALTPPDIEISIIDENAENINFDEKVDLVALTAMTPYAPRAYEIADAFKERGVKVVIGGIHASMLPEEAAEHADAVVIGEAEEIWEKIIEDFKQNQLQKFYRADRRPNLEKIPIPRWDLLNKYQYFNYAIQSTRGCPFDCDFCSVWSFLGKEIRCKQIEQVLKEVKLIQENQRKKFFKTIFFAEDNIISNRNHAKNLFKALIPLKLEHWVCQATINIAKDKELLELLKESNCRSIFIGFESLIQESLVAYGKRVNKVEEFHLAIETINSYGIDIIGSFILGGESDDESVFQKTIDFINETNMAFAMINILTPLPGTRLYKYMEKENRLLHKDWLKYDGNNVCFKPKLMSPKILQDGFYWVNQQLYSFNNFYKRLCNTWDKGISIVIPNWWKEKPIKDKILYLFLILKGLASLDMKRNSYILKLFLRWLEGKNINFTDMMEGLNANDFAFNFPKVSKPSFIKND